MSDDQMRSALRRLPSVDATVQSVRQELGDAVDQRYLTETVRQLVDMTRSRILGGDIRCIEMFEPRLQSTLAALVGNRVQTVINGTGVIVHTNLGRSPVSRPAADAMARAARNYVPLEVSLESGERGGRGAELSALMAALTGAEATLGVNNNAAAILLALSALCGGKRVIVSRGEAVEIGGGFRIPDVMRQSGAILVEVGTTNRTNLRDYASEIDEDTAAILTVHASNFEISGFTYKPALSELAALAHSKGILLIEDVGSGCLVQTDDYGLAHEPTLAESIEAGVDAVTASGDKLLGGPQAGLILGTRSAVDAIRQHPLARAVRTDKTVQAGLESTLRHYLRNEQDEEIPIWWMMSRTRDQLVERTARWHAALTDERFRLINTTSVIGGGSLPGKTLPSAGLAIVPGESSPTEIARSLRLAEQPVFPRVENDCVIIDARTVLPDQDEALIETLRTTLPFSGSV
ncbi:MAG: L-seryl-tRNA(Sec) selenium transferase [Thermomicrobiales bacterium]